MTSQSLKAGRNRKSWTQWPPPEDRAKTRGRVLDKVSDLIFEVWFFKTVVERSAEVGEALFLLQKWVWIVDHFA